MQSKGLVLPQRPYRTVISTTNNSRDVSRLSGCLIAAYPRYKIKSRRLELETFKIFTSTPEQSESSPKTSSSESKESNKEFVSLSSWAEDVSQPTSSDDWGPPPAKTPASGRHPIANALFTLSLGGIAVGAFFLGRKYNAYNQAMIKETSIAELKSTSAEKQLVKKDVPPAIADTTTGTPAAGAGHSILIVPTLPKDKGSKLASDASKNSIAPPVENVLEKKKEDLPAPPSPPLSSLPVTDALEEATTSTDKVKEFNAENKLDADLPSPSSLFEKDNQVVPVEDKKEEQGDEEQVPSTSENTVIAAQKGKNEEDNATDKESSSSSSSPTLLLPLRTAEAEAALERIRAIQQRRQDLYDRAIARQENKLTPLPSTESAAPSSSLPSGSQYQSEMVESVDHENDNAVEIPKGMSLLELRERAAAANKAAAASADAAFRAATASALAADAADTATHAAQKASFAAAKCQKALNMRSADAIEEAFKAATEAEETSEIASRKAAVSSAKAIISKRDAEKSQETASKAAELSRPHGIVAQTSAAWRQLRRDTGLAVEKTQENVQAGVAAARWMWTQGAEKVHYVSQGVVYNVQNIVKAVQEKLPATKTAVEVKPAPVEKKRRFWSGGKAKKVEVPLQEEPQKGWFGRNKAKK